MIKADSDHCPLIFLQKEETPHIGGICGVAAVIRRG